MDRRTDAALAGLASSNLAAQAGPRVLAGRRKVDDDMAQFARENAKEAFELGAGLIEKDMAAAQNAFAAGLEGLKSANSAMITAVQTASSEITGAENRAFNRALQARTQEIQKFSTLLDQLNKKAQLDQGDVRNLISMNTDLGRVYGDLLREKQNLRNSMVIATPAMQSQYLTQLNALDTQIEVIEIQRAAISSKYLPNLPQTPPPASGSNEQIIESATYFE